MIDINLVPEDLRKKKKSRSLLKGFRIPLEVVIGSAGGLFLILVLVHIILLFTITAKLGKKNVLLQEEKEIGPAKNKVEGVITDLRSLQARRSSLKEVMGEGTIQWARKFNNISDALIQGVWIKKISFNEEALFIKGSAISKQGREMVGVHNFASALKNHAEFMDGFKDFSLGAIQMRKIKDIDIADFLIKVEIQ
jgi:Tfp pilus assembly protein PilN